MAFWWLSDDSLMTLWWLSDDSLMTHEYWVHKIIIHLLRSASGLWNFLFLESSRMCLDWIHGLYLFWACNLFLEPINNFLLSCWCTTMLILFSDMIKIMSLSNSWIKGKLWRHASGRKFFRKIVAFVLCSDDKNLQDFWRQVCTCLVYYDRK